MLRVSLPAVGAMRSYRPVVSASRLGRKIHSPTHSPSRGNHHYHPTNAILTSSYHHHALRSSNATPSSSSQSSPSLSQSASSIAAVVQNPSLAQIQRSMKDIKHHAINAFHNTRHLLRHYSLGVKLIYRDYKEMRSIQLKHFQQPDLPHTWPEAVHMRRTRSDLSVGLPFIAVFALPIVGYAALIFAFLVPRYIPFALAQEKQIALFLKQDANASKQVLHQLEEMYTLHPHGCALTKMRELLEMIQAGQSRIDELRQLKPLAPMMHALTPTLMHLSRSHLLQLHQAVIHSGFLPKYCFTRKFLIRRLQEWRETILKEDKVR